MGKHVAHAVSPTRNEDYPEWYQQVIRAADMAEASPVRGCMVIKPWGYALWERMQQVLDRKFKETGHENAYFPLFIPKSFLEKEAEHIQGFSKECAVVTHHRLEEGPQGGLIPAGPLEEPLVVRPTSETMVGAMFAKWIQSHRDLPLLINQWANVVRWELRTRLFLRTTEFLWQEGHTAHASAAEAREETARMLEVYVAFAERYMAMPVVRGEKTAGERFPGAESTYSIEAMMQDRKALQAGTSHFLGQRFARAAGIRFQNEDGKEELAWTTSWGVSTRLIGGLIMAHGDDDGLVLPPRLAPYQVVILPVLHKDTEADSVLNYCRQLAEALRAQTYDGEALRVHIDRRDLRGGDKMWSWVKKGVPLRLEIGPRDVAADAVFLGRRDRGVRERSAMPRAAFVAGVAQLLEEIQESLYECAMAFRASHTHRIDSQEDFYAFFTPVNKDKPEIHGGFALTHWCGDASVEETLARDLNVTIRCLPLDEAPEEGLCPFSGRSSPRRVVFAKAY